jgi:thiol:disulfide interchange protein DsbC
MLNLRTNSLAARCLAAVMLITFPLTAPCVTDAPADPATVAFRQMLAKRYPATSFGDIQRSAVPGIWEVWMGTNVAYVADEGRHFIFGHVYDMQTQTDITAQKKEQISVAQEAARPKLSFSDLPLSDAIKTVKGTGARKIAVFSDPHCQYCRNLEAELEKVDNVTVYTFLFPNRSLDQDAFATAEAIWCAPNRAAAWKNYMSAGTAPMQAHCSSPIGRIIALAEKAGIHGTPFLFFGNGTKAAGALDAAGLESRLSNK